MSRTQRFVTLYSKDGAPASNAKAIELEIGEIAGTLIWRICLLTIASGNDPCASAILAAAGRVGDMRNHHQGDGPEDEKKDGVAKASGQGLFHGQDRQIGVNNRPPTLPPQAAPVYRRGTRFERL